MIESMRPKFLASWLVVVTIVPFTALFSICNVVDRQGHRAPFAPPTSAVRNDSAFPNGSRISTAGRVRLARLLALPLVHTNPSTSLAGFMSRCVSAGFIAEQLTFTTILRL
jgi:hypothetical protein